MNAINDESIMVFESNQKLLFYFIKKYRPYSTTLDFDDYKQIVSLAFFKACKNLNVKKGTLSALASYYIFNSLSAIYNKQNRQKRIKNCVELTSLNAPYYIPKSDYCEELLTANLSGEKLSIMKEYYLDELDMKIIAKRHGYSRQYVSQVISGCLRHLKFCLK